MGIFEMPDFCLYQLIYKLQPN